MIHILYILFFLALNIHVYLVLNKLFISSNYISIGLSLLFIVIIFIHQLNLIPCQISPFNFYQISIFSFTLIGWFFLNKLLIKRLNKKKNRNYFNNIISNIIRAGIFINALFVITTVYQIIAINDIITR